MLIAMAVNAVAVVGVETEDGRTQSSAAVPQEGYSGDVAAWGGSCWVGGHSSGVGCGRLDSGTGRVVWPAENVVEVVVVEIEVVLEVEIGMGSVGRR